MKTKKARYEVWGAYGDMIISRHESINEAHRVFENLSWYERSATPPHDAHIIDTHTGLRVTSIPFKGGTQNEK